MRDLIVMASRCRAGWVVSGAGLVLALGLPACGAEDPDAVAGFQGYSLDAATLESEFRRVNSDRPWEASTVAERADFAELLLKKEMLVRIAGEACPEPDRKAGRLNRVLYEKTLMNEFLTARRERFSMPEEQVELEAAKLKRQARAYVATVLQADVESIRNDMFAGGTYEEVARKYVSDLGPQGRGFSEMTIGIDNMPRPVIRAVFLNDVPAGTVVGPVSSTQAVYFLKVLEYTPWELAEIPGAMERARAVVADAYYQPFNQAYTDSLNEASGIQMYPDSYPLVLDIMAAFWDSINVARDSGESVEFQEFLAPVWRVPDDQAEIPVMDLFGKTYGIREFIDSLNDIDLDHWVTVGTLGKITFQIENRGTRLLYILEAEKTGVPDRPSFQATMGRLREQHLLDQFRLRYLPDQFVPEEGAAEAQYRANPERYNTADEMAYGLLIFPLEREARAREVHEILRSSDPVRWFELAASEASADTSVQYHADTGLRPVQSAPPNPSWEPFRLAALGLEPGEITDVLRTQHGFTIVRCNQREHPRRMTYEEAEDAILADLRLIWVDEEMDRLLAEAMESRGAKVDTVKIEALKMAEASSSSSSS